MPLLGALAGACTGPRAAAADVREPHEGSTPTPNTAVALIIENASDESVCYVFIDPSSAGAQGPDRLAADETIRPGAQHGFTMAAGQYDLRLEDCNREPMFERRAVTITSPGIAVRFRHRE